jgi:hypothetical protein
MGIFTVTLIIQIVATILLMGMFMLFREMEDESARSNWKNPLKFLWWTFSTHWLNTGTSWKDKWALDETGNVQLYEPKWWYFLSVKPKYKEKFFLSSTWLVSLTDGEHAFQKQQLNSIFGAFFVWNWIAGLSVIIGIYGMLYIKEKWLKQIN